MFLGVDFCVDSNVPPTEVWMVGDGETYKIINIGKFPRIRFFLFKIKMFWYKINGRLYIYCALLRGKVNE